jgi:hypothetical protein
MTRLSPSGGAPPTKTTHRDTHGHTRRHHLLVLEQAEHGERDVLLGDREDAVAVLLADLSATRRLHGGYIAIMKAPSQYCWQIRRRQTKRTNDR